MRTGDSPLVKISNRIGPDFDPWDPQLVTSLQPDFVLLTTALWAQLFSQFSSHSF